MFKINKIFFFRLFLFNNFINFDAAVKVLHINIFIFRIGCCLAPHRRDTVTCIETTEIRLCLMRSTINPYGCRPATTTSKFFKSLLYFQLL